MPQFIHAGTEEHYRAAGTLFREYADSLEIDLCFQGFENELKNLPVIYASQTGGIILCRVDDMYAGCIAVRKIDNETCELKRMFIRNSHRGKGIARRLLELAIELAREKGYSRMRLDTLTTMKPAIHLYRECGFYEIPAYYFNPEKNVLFMETVL